MTSINEKEKNVSIALVFVGQGESQNVMSRLMKLNISPCHILSYKTVKVFANNCESVDGDDFVIVIADSEEITPRRADVLANILEDKIEIVFVLGSLTDAEARRRLMEKTRSVFFEKTLLIGKPMAVVLEQLIISLTKPAVMQLDYGDVERMLKYRHNFVWYGKGFGVMKGAMLAKQITDTAWYRKGMAKENLNLIVVVSGDFNLIDCECLLRPINDKQKNSDGLCLVLRYEEQPYEELGVLVLGSF